MPLMLAGFLTLLDLSVWIPRAAFVLECLALATFIVAVLVAAQTVRGTQRKDVPPSPNTTPVDPDTQARLTVGLPRQRSNGVSADQ